MASSAGSGDRSPAPRARAVVEDLFDVRERAAMLRTMLEGSSTPPSAAGRELMEGMMSSLSSALSALNTGGGGDGGASSSAGGRGSGGRRRRDPAVGGPHRRRSSSSGRRRTLSPFVETVTANTLNDGNSWRKYGQKRIQDSSTPRSYYRCTHMTDQGCKARKQVQVSETNPSEYIISYFGQHTCRDPSTIPLVIEAAAAPPDGANFISFGNGATTSGHAVPHHQVVADPATTMMRSRFGYLISSSLPEQERCGSEEAISPAGQLGVGSAPEHYWPGGGSQQNMAGGIDTGSFPSSPSSLGFMAGSFGSFGNGMDDDLFGFDL